MAGFTNLIFISYAHADNRDGWVDAFHASLEDWLGVNAVTAQIWRDKKLGGADVFSDEILAQLRRSALLISILSPNGMKFSFSLFWPRPRQSKEHGCFRSGSMNPSTKSSWLLR